MTTTATRLRIIVSRDVVFGAALQFARKNSGLRQEILADAVGVGVSTWSRYENGEAAFAFTSIYQALPALGLKQSEFFAILLDMESILKQKGIDIIETNDSVKNYPDALIVFTKDIVRIYSVNRLP